LIQGIEVVLRHWEDNLQLIQRVLIQILQQKTQRFDDDSALQEKQKQLN
jgi:hypothetical protein